MRVNKYIASTIALGSIALSLLMTITVTKSITYTLKKNEAKHNALIASLNIKLDSLENIIDNYKSYNQSGSPLIDSLYRLIPVDTHFVFSVEHLTPDQQYETVNKIIRFIGSKNKECNTTVVQTGLYLYVNPRESDTIYKHPGDKIILFITHSSESSLNLNAEISIYTNGKYIIKDSMKNLGLYPHPFIENVALCYIPYSPEIESFNLIFTESNKKRNICSRSIIISEK